MKFYPVNARLEDGRQEWLNLRLGIPTASNFHKILTPSKMQVSSQARGYMNELLEEWVTGREIESPQTEWMVRGIEDEDRAVAAYEGIYEIETSLGGFFTTDDGLIGASPDRLIGDRGDLEIKTGAIRTMIGYALHGGIADDHKAQVQGRLMIHERDYVDVFPYNDTIMLKAVRVQRDEKFIAALRAVLKTFVEQMLEARLKLEREFGPFVRPEAAPPVDHSKDFISDADLDAILAARKG